MTWPDMVNAAFELLGGAMLWLTVLTTYRAKRVVGVAIPTVLFFVAWDVWFLCFYWQLAQWASFVAGLWLTAAQATWLGQMIYYRLQMRRFARFVNEVAVILDRERSDDDA